MSKIENFGIEKMVSTLDQMNSRGSFKMADWNTIVIKGIDPHDVKYPEGYYYIEKNGITNKHNTATGIYESFQVIVDN